MKVSIIGLGSRGKNYGTHLSKMQDVQIVAVCDKYRNKVDIVGKMWGVAENMRFTDENEFFALGKVADVMVIATQDRDHYSHSKKALELGYNLLVEKPLSPIIEECLELEKLARVKGLKVLVCHVLRYAPYYRKIKEIIASGILGEVKEIRHSENISYWHYTHSYVRGNWRREDTTSPLLLAKCCHDADLLYWFTGSKCKSLSSYGSQSYFNHANAPEGAAQNCFDCKLRTTCLFEAEYQYCGRKTLIGRTKPKFPWGTYAFCQSADKKDILAALKTGERGKEFARCVFHCDNNVVDRQTVMMEMQNGIICTLTVDAFNDKNHRHTEIRGSKGMLIADDSHSVLTLKLFDKAAKRITVNPLAVLKGHYGGDQGIVKAVYNILNVDGDYPGYTWIKDTVESHRIVAAAELSRAKNGEKVDMQTIPDII
ncbi:MAG: Gfo/Idh/MocA family oxidoreductase [Clostridia bacterium]|nr:Gfo/Idh/MocA family oxidoreductase [Clostridia bacterium]